MFFNILINSLREVVNSKAAGAPAKIVLSQSEGGEAGEEQPPARERTLSNPGPAPRTRRQGNGTETSERLVLPDSREHARKVANSPVSTHLTLYPI